MRISASWPHRQLRKAAVRDSCGTGIYVMAAEPPKPPGSGRFWLSVSGAWDPCMLFASGMGVGRKEGKITFNTSP